MALKSLTTLRHCTGHAIRSTWTSRRSSWNTEQKSMPHHQKEHLCTMHRGSEGSRSYAYCSNTERTCTSGYQVARPLSRRLQIWDTPKLRSCCWSMERIKNKVAEQGLTIEYLYLSIQAATGK